MSKHHIRKLAKIRRLIRQGLSDAEIAKQCSTSPKVVAYERTRPKHDSVPEGEPMTEEDRDAISART